MLKHLNDKKCVIRIVCYMHKDCDEGWIYGTCVCNFPF